MKGKRKGNPRPIKPSLEDGSVEPTTLRIVGGSMRGRKLLFSGEQRTRPMKERVREAVFNLVGPGVQGMHAIDLFAGTGALGLEAVSRGAARATFVEQHFPTAALIRQNAAALGAAQQCEVRAANVFIWAQLEPPAGDLPWVVFCSPPYAFYSERLDDMLSLIGHLKELAPVGSLFVVEADRQFDMALLPDAPAWDVREYPPATVAIYRK